MYEERLRLPDSGCGPVRVDLRVARPAGGEALSGDRLASAHGRGRA